MARAANADANADDWAENQPRGVSRAAAFTGRDSRRVAVNRVAVNVTP